LSQTLDTAVHLEPDPAALSAQISDPEIAANALMALSQAGVVVTSFSLGQPSLDEVFLALTGQPIDDETVATEEVVA
jgi:ABC-2 type transport system ATP-binding protein